MSMSTKDIVKVKEDMTLQKVFASADELLMPDIVKDIYINGLQKFIKVRSITGNELSQAHAIANDILGKGKDGKPKNDDGQQLGYILISLACVEPKLTLPQAYKLKPTINKEISTAILDISGYTEEASNEIANLSVTEKTQ